jgi:lipoprotein-anchoring transpeptidase ErfK/SrfK
MKLLIAFFALTLAASAHAASANDYANFLDEFNPSAPDAQQVLDFYDNYYREETGKSADVTEDFQNLVQNAGPDCYQNNCRVWAEVVKSEQRLYLHIDGKLAAVWKTSTAKAGFVTPDFNRHPDGRIYDSYTSKKYPGGDYNGMGNMPYAVFISGGFAIHGTGRGNWAHLGHPASHGCIRILPDNAYTFNTYVRAVGIHKTWITVSQKRISPANEKIQ